MINVHKVISNKINNAKNVTVHAQPVSLIQINVLLVMINNIYSNKDVMLHAHHQLINHQMLAIFVKDVPVDAKIVQMVKVAQNVTAV